MEKIPKIKGADTKFLVLLYIGEWSTVLIGVLGPVISNEVNGGRGTYQFLVKNNEEVGAAEHRWDVGDTSGRGSV